MKTITLKNDDPSAAKHYLKGDSADVLQSFSKLAASRWWHYKVKLHTRRHVTGVNGEQRGLSRIAYLTKDEVAA